MHYKVNYKFSNNFKVLKNYIVQNKYKAKFIVKTINLLLNQIKSFRNRIPNKKNRLIQVKI